MGCSTCLKIKLGVNTANIGCSCLTAYLMLLIFVRDLKCFLENIKTWLCKNLFADDAMFGAKNPPMPIECNLKINTNFCKLSINGKWPEQIDIYVPLNRIFAKEENNDGEKSRCINVGKTIGRNVERKKAYI